MYEDENIQRPFQPLDVLMLELAEDEFAIYTVREVRENCHFSVLGAGQGSARVAVYFNDQPAGEFELDSELKVYDTPMLLPAADEVMVRLAVVEGCAQLKTLQFYY